jgi:hypothetical protein
MPLSYLRVAALGCDSIAGDLSLAAAITKLLDVNLSAKEAAALMSDRAAKYRQVDDESGAFVMIEQCNTQWAFIDRYWAQVQRQTGGGF